MTRRSVVLVALFSLLLFSVLPSLVRAEVLFGPVTVTGGQTHTATFPMYCRCTAYFLEAINVSTQEMRPATISLNGQVVMEVSNQWTQMSRQVELAETEPNEIEITVLPPAGSGLTVRVYERDVTPAPMEGREYVKVRPSVQERFSERFVLNHWAARFHLAVQNGDPDGTHRVLWGSVFVNGAEVVGIRQLHSGVGSVSVEVELQEGENDIQARLIGPVGSKIRIGIEEPAQTVTVTEQWEVELPLMPEQGGISVVSGEPQVRLADNIRVVDLDGVGNQITRVYAQADTSEQPAVLSQRGTYVWTYSIANWVRYFHLYDRNWNQLFQTNGDTIWAQQVAEAGTALLAWDMPTAGLEPCGGGGLIAVYDFSGTLTARVPRGAGHSGDFDIFNQFSSDGLYYWGYCDGKLQVYGIDGTLAWEAPFRQSRDLGNGGLAVQATQDSLLFHAADGTLVRRVLTERPANDCGLSRTTPDGSYGILNGATVLGAFRFGPQSCWEFDPGSEYYINYPWLADNGRFVLAKAHGPGSGPVSTFFLFGRGGDILWQSSTGRYLWLSEAILSEEGDYFFVIEFVEFGVSPNTYCRLYRVITE